MEHLPYTTVVPAAGECVRFRKAGYALPKGLLRLEWNGSEASMIEHVVGRDHDATIVCKAQDFNLFKRKLPYLKIVPIASTEGQAHTIFQGIADLALDRPLLVINCDNAFDIELDEFVKECVRTQATCGAVVFESELESKYGYVDAQPWFSRGAEKSPISGYALAGAFYFANTLTYVQAFRTGKNPACYVSALFEHITGSKLAYKIERSQLHEWGTPEDIKLDSTVKGFM
jgi:NDP-sugar pyrophosphorylase family protein